MSWRFKEIGEKNYLFSFCLWDGTISESEIAWQMVLASLELLPRPNGSLTKRCTVATVQVDLVSLLSESFLVDDFLALNSIILYNKWQI